MDVLSVRWVPAPEAFVDDLEAVICVNGWSIIDLAREAELPFAEPDGQPSIAGAYRGLPPAVVLAPTNVLLGRAEPSTEWPNPELYYQNGSVTLLSCECGEPGCWSLVARLQLDYETVTWSEFAQPHRPKWDLSALGAFVFDRRQYEEALARPDGEL